MHVVMGSNVFCYRLLCVAMFEYANLSYVACFTASYYIELYCTVLCYIMLLYITLGMYFVRLCYDVFHCFT